MTTRSHAGAGRPLPIRTGWRDKRLEILQGVHDRREDSMQDQQCSKKCEETKQGEATLLSC